MGQWSRRSQVSCFWLFPDLGLSLHGPARQPILLITVVLMSGANWARNCLLHSGRRIFIRTAVKTGWWSITWPHGWNCFHWSTASAEPFVQHQPAPLTEVDIMSGGLEALKEANISLGLALADDEIEYLVASFSLTAIQPMLSWWCLPQTLSTAVTKFLTLAGLWWRRSAE